MNNESIELRWGTQTPIHFNDSAMGDLEYNVKGICKFKILNTNITEDLAKENLYNTIINCVNNVCSNSNITERIHLQTKLPGMIQDEAMKLQLTDFSIDTFLVTGVEFTESSLAVMKEFKEKRNTKVVQTDAGAQNGQTKCPKCGATDISPTEDGKLRCNYCRTVFDPVKVEGLDGDVTELKGNVIGSGAQDIDDSFDSVITLKCSSCGAEVVIDTSEVTHARCHWCRNTLSINQQIPNGSVPDVILPFFISKDDARAEIEKFVNSRKFYANPKFKAEFTTENINGVYFPYMVVDVNASCYFKGRGEHLTRRYTVKVNDHNQTYYDADVYDVSRKFDIAIDDLTIESSSNKLDKSKNDETTNVINAIMPFDLMNAVKWDANYLKGFSSEKRDLNVDQLKDYAEAQSRDVSRFAANDSLEFYDRGVAWETQNIDIKGQQWKAAYLPVWLYSYQEVNGEKKVLHYVAVNGRTKEVMGSVPIHMPKLLFVSFLFELLGVFAMLLVDFEFEIIFLAAGFVYYFIIYSRYRNKDARHRHELETRRMVSNLEQEDTFVRSNNRQSSSRMIGANNTSVDGLDAGIASLKDKLKM